MIQYLLGKASTGKYRFVVIFWDEIWDDIENGYLIIREYGQVHGKTTTAPKIWIKKGLAGRSHREQATLKFNSLVKEYLDKGYVTVDKHPNEYSEVELNEIFGENKTNQAGVIKPQLAKQSDKVTNRKIFDNEWLASRKINGVRALFYFDGSEIHVASRGGDMYDYSTIHLREHPVLLEIFTKYPTLILDCELYKFGKSLQQCSGAARLEKNAVDCDWLEMYCYDCIFTDNMEMIAKDRIKFIQDIATKFNLTFDPTRIWQPGELQIQIVPHVIVSGWNNMKILHDQYVSEGWEGLVIRDPGKVYIPSGRTNAMIKIKNYLDETFKVVGYELGLRGSEDMVFICKMQDGRTFKASPMGDRRTKEEYVQNFKTKYLNQLGDCKYFEYSDEGIPCQPKFICFRYDLEEGSK